MLHLMECILLSSSPGEEMALLEHTKGMSLADGAKRELKSLLISLLMLGEEDTARKLQQVGLNFQLSQIAAVKLAEDATSSDQIDESAFSLENYIQKERDGLHNSEAFYWMSKTLL